MPRPAALMPDADVIVVGAGPGGSAAAAALGRRGRRVLLLEAQRFPRDKVCGDVLLREVASSLVALGTSLDELAPDAHTVSACDFTTGRGTRAVGHFRDRHGRTHPWRILPRRLLDERLARHAERCGARLEEGCRLEHAEWDAVRRLTVVQVRHRDRALTYRAPLVIGADGVFSRVAACRGLAPVRAARDRRYSVALRGYADWASSQPHFQVLTDGALEFGCCWIVPISPTRANVGVGLLDARRRPTRAELSTHMQRMLGARVDLRGMSELAGWQLPSARLTRRAVADGTMLVGDAAGFVDPFTGHGIHNALASGLMAAESADHAIAIADSRATSPPLRRYERAWRRRFAGDFLLGRLLQSLHGSQPLLEAVMAPATRHAGWADQVMGLVGHAGRRHDMLRPGFLWRLLRSQLERPSADRVRSRSA